MTFFKLGLIVRWALIKCGANDPAPTIIRSLESCLDKYWEAKAETQAVRTRVSWVPSMEARVWPVRELKRR